MSTQYKIPEYVHVSQDCKELLSRIFVANSAKVTHIFQTRIRLSKRFVGFIPFPNFVQRITIREIRNHPWFLKNLPRELTEAAQAMYYKKDNSAPTYSVQSVEDIMKIVEKARTPPPSSTPVAGFGWAQEDEEEDSKKPEENGEEEEDGEDEYEKQVKQVHASGEFHIS
jgi:serine/threonine-protein kinase SRK2